MVQFIDGKPSRPLRRPVRRHYLHHVNTSSMAKDRTTIILPWVDIADDVRAINDGRGTRKGNTVRVNGRLYGIKPTAVLYPISGVGFVLLDRGAYREVGYYNEFGVTDLAEQQMDRFRIIARSREVARQLLEAGDTKP